MASEDSQPWWHNNPELQELTRRRLTELGLNPDDYSVDGTGDSSRDADDDDDDEWCFEDKPSVPDPVLADFYSGAGRAMLSAARDNLSDVSKQLLHRRFRQDSAA